jgi:deoxyhypusine synthase
MDDSELNKKGINRIGNILVPNDRYEALEDMIVPFFEKIFAKERIISPSELIERLGLTISDKRSILYWASRNKIPIFCPAITDGALGLQIFFYKQKRPEIGIDVTADMKRLADITLNSNETGGIVLGGGFAKHHAIGVNILREGMDYAVYVSTGTQYDGSMSGARVQEAVSWNKLKRKADSVFVEGDASILFPLIISSLR